MVLKHQVTFDYYCNYVSAITPILSMSVSPSLLHCEVLWGQNLRPTCVHVEQYLETHKSIPNLICMKNQQKILILLLFCYFNRTQRNIFPCHAPVIRAEIYILYTDIFTLLFTHREDIFKSLLTKNKIYKAKGSPLP